MKKLYQTVKISRVVTLLLLGIFMLIANILAAQEVTIYTDKDDYWPGEWVVIQGSGWIPGDTVVLSITHIGDVIPDHTHDPWKVIADANGEIYDEWFVFDTELGTTMWLQAQSLLYPEMYAESTFTDGRTYYTANLSIYQPGTYTRKVYSQVEAPVGRGTSPLNTASSTPVNSITNSYYAYLGLGQIIPYEVLITVSNDLPCTEGAINFKINFDSNFGYDITRKVVGAFVNADRITIGKDVSSQATVSSYTSDIITANEVFQGSINVSGLNPGDVIPVEIWVVLESTVPAGGLNGNFSASMDSGEPIDNCNAGVSVNGNLNFNSIRNFTTVPVDLEITKTGPVGPVLTCSDIEYTITVTNKISSDPNIYAVANAVEIKDILDLNTDFNNVTYDIVSGDNLGAGWSLKSQADNEIVFYSSYLDYGESATITLKVTANEDAPLTGVTNTATTTTISSDGTPGNNTSSATTILENTNPVAVCKDITVELDETGNASIDPIDVDNGSSDNCTINRANATLSTSKFTCANTGENIVTLTIVDASGAVGTCTAKVTVIGSIETPAALAQSFCASSNPTVADLVATGINLKWYDVATNGTVLENTTPLASATYYVSQTSAQGCESSRTPVSVTLNPSPTITTQPEDQYISEDTPISFSVEAINFDSYQWQIWNSSIGENGDWENITGATEAIYNFGVPTYDDGGKLFRCGVTNDCGTVYSSSAEIVPLAGCPAVEISSQPSSITDVCLGTTGLSFSVTVNASTIAQATYQWYKVIEGGDDYAIPGATSSTYNLTALTADMAGSYYVVISRACGQNVNSETSDTVDLVILPNASVSSVTGTSPLCIGNSAAYVANNAVLGGGTGAWSSSDLTIATVDPTSGEVTAVGAGTANITYTISGGCGGTTSALQSITVNPLTVGGTVSSDQDICANTAPSDLTLVDNIGDIIKWQKSSDFVFTSPVDISETSSTLTGTVIGPLSATTYFRAVVQSGVCAEANSSVATIGVYGTTITSGTVGGSAELDLCDGGNPAAFTVGEPTGGDGNYVYQWEQSENCSDSWTNAVAQDAGPTNTLSFNPPALNSTLSSMCYRLKITDGCGSVGYSTTKTYNIYEDPVSQSIIPTPADGSSICVGSSVSATFAGGSGGIPGSYTDVYQYSVDAGSNWSTYTTGNPIVATESMVGTDMIKIRTRREASGSGCNDGLYNYVTWTVQPVPSLSINDIRVSEAAETAHFTVELSHAVVCDVTFDVATADNTATAGSDYTAIATTQYIISAGNTSITVDVPISNDNALEADETFFVNLSNPENATIADGQGEGIITNDDAAAVTIADVSGEEDGGAITVTLALDNAVQGGFTVHVNTADGTATIANSDYTAVTGQTITFVGNALETQTFTVTPTADAILEADETLTVSMTNLVGLPVNISDGATVTITNDDAAAVTIADVSGEEDGGAITVTLALDNAVQGGFTVHVNTA
ncbi:Calx-beta domain-containing protein, partial [Maribellus sp. YY47]|uniref:Calx-beta domain-containing protein n=1 Tax=Maribellus sp. YY47 TaxID=2929486 RepID=UPI00249520E8